MDIVEDRFSRSRLLFGDKFENFKNIKILVCGCGGVGGACIDALYRIGFIDITYIDFDKFDITNQNRQIGSEFLDKFKIDVFEKIYIGTKGINQKITEDFLVSFDISNFDFIVDAIDDMIAKVAIVKKVFSIKKENRPNFISSTGGAKKINPSKIKITDIWKTNTDPLAKKFRNELKKIGFKEKFKVVFSDEEPMCISLGSCKIVTHSFGLYLAYHIVSNVTHAFKKNL